MRTRLLIAILCVSAIGALSSEVLAQRGGAKLYSQLCPLFEWSHDSDGPVTQGMREVYAGLAQELKQLETEFQTLRDGDLAKINELARKLDAGTVVVPRPGQIGAKP